MIESGEKGSELYCPTIRAWGDEVFPPSMAFFVMRKEKLLSVAYNIYGSYLQCAWDEQTARCFLIIKLYIIKEV